MRFTYTKLCEIAGYDEKKLTDDRTILRRDTGVDFIKAQGALGVPLIADRDDVAATILYAAVRDAGQPVKLAGLTAARIRDAMQAHPEADQLTIVTLENRFTFTLPCDPLDLRDGDTSGGKVVTATMVDVRNLRGRVQRAVDAYEPVIGADDEAA
jgi:hypothetical protein